MAATGVGRLGLALTLGLVAACAAVTPAAEAGLDGLTEATQTVVRWLDPPARPLPRLRNEAPRSTADTPAPAPAPAPAGAIPASTATIEPPGSPPPTNVVAKPREPLEMTFVGDMIFGRYRETGYDPIPKEGDEVFAEVAELMDSDLLVGNLETPLVHDLPGLSPIVSTYRFGADAQLADHLRRGGFDAVSLANNHAFDMRAAGVEQTPQILDELGVVPLGAARHDAPRYRVETIEKQGWRVGFIAITVPANIDNLDGLPPLPRVELGKIATVIPPVVEQARLNHDLVAVLVHWGDEYADEPSVRQRRAAHALVQAGADLVIGHHPHVLQGIERYGHGLIAYSMGNFVFENVKEVPRQTAILRTRFDAQGCLRGVVMHPAFIKSVPFKHPAPAVGFMGGKVKARIRSLGQSWGTRWRDDGDALAMEGLDCPGGPAPRASYAAP